MKQTVSRFLPNVLTYRALTDLGVENATLAEKLPGLVTDSIEKLSLRQKDDGGWGGWIDSQSNPYLTAYVVYGLIQARNAGLDVRADVLDRGEQFVVGQLSNQVKDLNRRAANQQAGYLFVLSEDSQAPAGQINTLFEERIQSLLPDLNNAAGLSATGAHWEADNADTRGLSPTAHSRPTACTG